MSSDEPTPNPARSTGWRATLADLDARMRRAQKQIATRVDGLDKRLAETSTVISETLPRVDDLADGLAEMRGRLDAHTDGAGSTFQPVNWPSLSADEARVAWEALATWIGSVLLPWYALTRGQLPDCWPLHRRAVVELSWLRTSYLVAYSSKASASMAAEWHTRWLREALNGVARSVPPSLCRPGAHLAADRARTTYQPPVVDGPGPGTVGAAFVDPREEPSQWYHWQSALELAMRVDLDLRQDHNQNESADQARDGGGRP